RARGGFHAGRRLLQRRRRRALTAPLVLRGAFRPDRRGRAPPRRHHPRDPPSPGRGHPRARVGRAAGVGEERAWTSRPGHLAAARDLYGSTAAFLSDEGRRLGIDTAFVDVTDTAAVLGAVRPNTRAVFLESLSNPLLRLADLDALAPELAPRGIDLIVDSSLASPAVLRPIEHGATMVMHSLTKFISGHGDVTGGIVLGKAEPMARVRAAMIRAGTNLGPFDAWLAT